jgi:hypothetical protein
MPRLLPKCRSEAADNGKHKFDRKPEGKYQRRAADRGLRFCSNKGCSFAVHYENYRKVKANAEA